MGRRDLVQIRECIKSGRYEMTSHANDEMAEDNLDVFDVETSILTGKISKIEKDDPRGTRYLIEGTASDCATLVGSVGRFTPIGKYRIITVYEIKL